MDEFEDVLNEVKYQFVDWKALIVLDDKPLRKYCMAWSPALVQRHTSWPLFSTLPSLWDCVTVDFQALAELTGDSMPEVMMRFRQAQGLQVIYPDGTVAEHVCRVLQKKWREIVDA